MRVPVTLRLSPEAMAALALMFDEFGALTDADPNATDATKAMCAEFALAATQLAHVRQQRPEPAPPPITCTLCARATDVPGPRHPESAVPVRLPPGWAWQRTARHVGDYDAEGFPLYSGQDLYVCPSCCEGCEAVAERQAAAVLQALSTTKGAKPS